ncbi:MAG: D-2-hydroxyacid dehydrogenase [Bacillota bacterium]
MKILALGVKPSHLGAAQQVAPDAHFVHVETKEEAEANIADAEILVSWGRLMTPELIAKAHKLAWIHVFSAGVDRLISPAMLASPAVLTNSRGAHAIPMAEHVMGLILAFERGLPALLQQQKERRWNPLKLREVYGSTLGLVGYGGIGREVARRARGFGMKIVAVRKHPAAEEGVEIWALERLDDLFAASDHVVASIPLTDESRHLIGERQFRAMKPTAYFFNLGRGPVVDEEALIAALREKRLAGAGLDVFETEPLPADSPLWDLPNVIVSPHTSASSPRQQERVVAVFAENLGRFLAGQPLINVVDKAAGY